MTTARTAMHYLVMAAFVCVTCLSAPAANAKSTPKQPKLTCLQVYNMNAPKGAKIVNVSLSSSSTLSAQDAKKAKIQAELRAALLKIALLALSKVPEGKACDALIAKIDAKFSRS
jgi:hypothetical protein